MYQKLQVFYRKVKTKKLAGISYKTKMVVYQKGETGLGEIGFYQLRCKVCFYTCIRAVGFTATSYYG